MNAAIAAVLDGAAFACGLGLVVAALTGKPARRSLRTASADVWGLLPEPKPSRASDLLLAGVTYQAYLTQRVAGLAGGLAAGAVAAAWWTSTATAAVAAVALCTLVGWLVPYQGVKDAAKRSRVELDQVVRLWIVLAAQQVAAGAEPANAMLIAAQAGKRPTWRLLHRHLLSAQNERRPASDGLSELVERYGLVSLTQAVGAFGLAARRGTRMADAVLAAADNLWRDTMQREREAAERRNQIIVLPATAVALALAAILIYPPFVSLTGGIVANAP
ncbi:type II secretion system F family protein [Candidatus Poriferisodalis sp.]|uniref:type II secretion system F family protein n=1 Tax=Candidatus Poriferisodalis sp. TaxID=3101277 RepID=UPI003D10E81E